MKNEEIKIKIGPNKIITLKELLEGKKKARKNMAALPFEKKIDILISLQETARSWGGAKNLIVWNK